MCHRGGRAAAVAHYYSAVYTHLPHNFKVDYVSSLRHPANLDARRSYIRMLYNLAEQISVHSPSTACLFCTPIGC